MRNFIVIIFTISSLWFANLANAKEITYEFTIEATYVYDNLGISGVQIGDQIVGYYTFEDSALGGEDPDEGGDSVVSYPDAITDFQIGAGNFEFNLHLEGESSKSIEFAENHSNLGPNLDWYVVSATISSPEVCFPDNGDNRFVLELEGVSPSDLFHSADLTETPPNLAVANYKNEIQLHAQICSGGPQGAIEIHGILTNVNLIPSTPAIGNQIDFKRTWGWGVDTGANAFEICTDESVPCLAGDFGVGLGQFSGPAGIRIISPGNIYVTDGLNGRIQQFDTNGNFVQMWGTLGVAEGELNYPGGISGDGSGNVYIAEYENHRIQKFDESGNFQRMWGWGVETGASEFEICTSDRDPEGACQTGVQGSGEGQFSRPTGITADGAGNVYVGDFENNRIQHFDDEGNFVGAWGTGEGDAGAGAGELGSPVGLLADDGTIYVAEAGNNRVQQFDGEGTFIRMWGWGVETGANEFEICTSESESCQTGISGGGAGQFEIPIAIGVDDAGTIYVTDSINNRVQRFDASGNFLQTWGWGVDTGANAFEVCTSASVPCHSGIPGEGAGQLNIPIGITVDGVGNVYVADAENGRIQQYVTSVPTTSIAFLQMWGWGVESGEEAFETCSAEAESCQTGLPGNGSGQFESPAAIRLGSPGNVYVSGSVNHRVQQFDTSGNFVREWGGGEGLGEGAGEFNLSGGITGDGTGDVYVGDFHNNRVQKFDESGNFLRMWGWGVESGEEGFDICTSESESCQAASSIGLGNGQLSNPAGVTADGTGNVYVADVGNNRVQQFDSNGNFLRTWGTDGDGSGEFQTPLGLLADGTGNVFVADVGNNRVQQFDANGNFLRTWGWGVETGADEFQVCTSESESCQAGIEGGGAGQFELPAAIGVDDAGTIYVTDSGNARVQQFDASGNFLQTWGWGVESGENIFEICNNDAESCQAGIPGGGVGQLDMPIGLTVDDAGDIYVTDTENHRIQVFRAQLTTENEPPVADAGNDQMIHVEKMVILSGSGSFDDSTQPENLVYDWEFIEVPEGSAATLNDANTGSPIFYADSVGTYAVALTVTDDEGASSAVDKVEISVDSPPVTNAGENQILIIGNEVYLNGSGSFDTTEPEDPLTYNWVFTAKPVGSMATITDSDQEFSSFVPDVVGTYVVELTVGDYLGTGELDSVNIVVLEDPDRDGDGIQNDIDTQPDLFSDHFTDGPLSYDERASGTTGGTTFGRIDSRGDNSLELVSDGATSSIRVSIGSETSSDTLFTICLGEQFVITAKPGSQGTFLCGSLHAIVYLGYFKVQVHDIVVEIPEGVDVQIEQEGIEVVVNVLSESGSVTVTTPGGIPQNVYQGDGAVSFGDEDADGVPDDEDNCPADNNADQDDFDSDGIGDACDSDIDADGVNNELDRCEFTTLGDVVNPSRGCAIYQLVPCDGPRGQSNPWKNHGQFMNSLVRTVKRFRSNGLITQNEAKAIRSEARRSSCGRKARE